MTDPSLKVVIRCGDIGASRAFYGDILGLEITDDWEEPQGAGCIFSLGSSLIELHEMTPHDHRYDPKMRQPVQVDKIDVQLAVADLEPWLERLDGRWDHGEPKVQPWGERTVRMRDPDGVLVTIYEKV
jgi:catechol 2,3-dioxygenase-like lactoylglutathione lyase family enzyme